MPGHQYRGFDHQVTENNKCYSFSEVNLFGSLGMRTPRVEEGVFWGNLCVWI